jgi:uncharacterized protein
MVFMGVLSFVFLICSLRTNILNIVVYVSLILGFSFLTAQHFQLAEGNVEYAGQMQVVGCPTEQIICRGPIFD